MDGILIIKHLYWLIKIRYLRIIISIIMVNMITNLILQIIIKKDIKHH